MFNTLSHSKNILTVSKLNSLARSVLEAEIGQIWLSAEISNFVAAASGHWYFTLKDNRAQVKAAMFKGANRRVIQKPKEGDKVLVRANIGLYEPRGDYQLIVEHLEPEGEGQLKAQFEKLKQQLAYEGLFATEHKQAIPIQILKVGIVTSATGAALHDILTVLKRRNPAIQVVIYPTQVQGDAAPAQICNAINIANQRNEVEILIVGRGGGSLEDLWCFNDETVARTIFNSHLPIVSAVGHEVDMSIADFVADLRAPTPSAAAELISKDQSELMTKIATLEHKLVKGYKANQQTLMHQHQVLTQALLKNHPQKQLQQKYQYLDQLQDKLTFVFKRNFEQNKQQQQHLESRLFLASPNKRLQTHQQTLLELQDKLNKNCQQLLLKKQQQLANNSHLLDTVSPLATLSRGYNISFKQGEIIKSVKQIDVGDDIVSRFVDGEIKSTVSQSNEQ
ncbi:exodeoxyribonuclease VII large subunit [Paraglaciecola sp. L3A3]|uniref:exodeoxyribonuclease VII large subunit n=1 Tax=Paraglaciecola sp. L3A3 TaxID=2686358 RepID=UPI00131D9010|nr:exodeoxyribonuclease VII large subunit [Paraglaciecola sp. L3A3]